MEVNEFTIVCHDFDFLNDFSDLSEQLITAKPGNSGRSHRFHGDVVVRSRPLCSPVNHQDPDQRGALRHVHPQRDIIARLNPSFAPTQRHLPIRARISDGVAAVPVRNSGLQILSRLECGQSCGQTSGQLSLLLYCCVMTLSLLPSLLKEANQVPPGSRRLSVQTDK